MRAIGSREGEREPYLFPAHRQERFFGHCPPHHHPRLTSKLQGREVGKGFLMCYAKARCLSATKGSKGVKLQACHSNSPSRKRKVGRKGGREAACVALSERRSLPPYQQREDRSAEPQYLESASIPVTHHVLHFLRLCSNSFPKIILSLSDLGRSQ